MIPIQYLAGWVPLTKTITATDTKPYPLVRKFTSAAEWYSKDYAGLEKLKADVVKYGQSGHCILKGELSQALVKESRAGKHIQSQSHWIVLDFDAIDISASGATTFGAAVDYVLGLMPASFREASYVAQASASFALDNNWTKASFHVFYWLEEPMLPSEITAALTAINNDVFKDKVSLTRSKLAVHFPLDICTGQSSRLIFIAPPKTTPDAVSRVPLAPGQRVFLSKNQRDTLKLEDNYSKVDVQKIKQGLLKDLRAAEGLPPLSPKSFAAYTGPDRTKDPAAQTASLIQKPGALQMAFYADNGNYVQYDVNGGDSHAYWVYKHDPTVVRNFKEEPFFSFAAADPAMYAWHLAEFCGKPLTPQDKKDLEEVGMDTVIPMVIRAENLDTYYSLHLDMENMSYERLNEAKSVNARQDFMKHYGSFVPDPIPQFDMEYRPDVLKTIVIPEDRGPGQGLINRFIATPLLRELDELASKGTVSIKDTWEGIERNAPNIAMIIKSITGDDVDCSQGLVKWISHIIQTRTKAKTAWILHGVQGTGKGVFLTNVLKPIFGMGAKEVRGTLLADKFDDFLDSTLILALDEVHLDPIKDSSSLEKLKHFITEEEIEIRNLGTGARQKKSYGSVLIFSNHADSVPLDMTDRRYNVAPRQQQALRARLGDAGLEALIDNIPDEIRTFATCCMNLKLDAGEVAKPITNAAKDELRQLTLSPNQEFTQAVQNVNIEYFSQVWETSVTGSGSAVELNQARATCESMINASLQGVGTSIFLEASDLLVLYRTITNDPQCTPRKLATILRRGGLALDLGKGPKMVKGLETKTMTQVDIAQKISDAYIKPKQGPVFGKPSQDPII